MKSSEEILKNENIYFGQENIGGIPCSIGYIKESFWSWSANLNTFIIIGNTNDRIDKKVIENFSKSCYEYSRKNNKGYYKGLRVGSISILQGRIIDNDAIEFCEKLSKKHWSAFEIPVLYNIDQNKGIRFKSKPIWGVIYFSFFARTIDSIISKFKE